MNNKEKVQDLEKLLDDIEDRAREIRIFNNVQPEHSERRFYQGQRKGMIELLLEFRPNSPEIMAHERKQKVRNR